MDFISNGFSYGNLREQAFIQTCKPTGTQAIMYPETPIIKSLSQGFFENRKPLKTGAFEQFFKLFPLASQIYIWCLQVANKGHYPSFLAPKCAYFSPVSLVSVRVSSC